MTDVGSWDSCPEASRAEAAPGSPFKVTPRGPPEEAEVYGNPRPGLNYIVSFVSYI
jgi:hypothetical protein